MTSFSNYSIHTWEPFSFENNSANNALVVLNRPIAKESEGNFTKLWKNSDVTFAVDGGTNKIYEWAKANNKLESFIPSYICGDLDSVEKDKLEFYLKKGSITVELACQDMNDFTKTLKFAIESVSKNNYKHKLIDKISSESLKNFKIKRIFCFCENTGRLDHILGNLNTLYDECLKETETYIINADSITCLLQKGINILYINNSLIEKNCGLIPLGDAAEVTTLGFKWNVHKQILKFGNFVSSSNEFESYDPNKRKQDLKKFFHDSLLESVDLKRINVLIETNEPIIFTFSI